MSVNYPGGRALPPGGDVGDVLTKTSDDDQAVAWAAPGSIIGGSLTLDPGDGTPVPVTGIVAPGADVVDGVATLATGGVQTVRLIGPFAVHWDDEGIEFNPGVKVTDLAAGATIIKIMVVTGTPWTGVVNPSLVFNVGDLDGSPRLEVEGYSLTSSGATTGGGMTLRYSGIQSAEVGTPGVVVFRDGGGVTALFAVFFYDSGTPDAGEANVYALIAEPSG